jgi:hypothetical protein
VFLLIGGSETAIIKQLAISKWQLAKAAGGGACVSGDGFSVRPDSLRNQVLPIANCQLLFAQPLIAIMEAYACRHPAR